MAKLQSLGLGFRQVHVAMVIEAVAMVIRVVAMEAPAMSMQLHVPVEADSTQLTMERPGFLSCASVALPWS